MSQCYQKFTVEKPGNPTNPYCLFTRLGVGWRRGYRRWAPALKKKEEKETRAESPPSQISVLLGHQEDLWAINAHDKSLLISDVQQLWKETGGCSLKFLPAWSGCGTVIRGVFLKTGLQKINSVSHICSTQTKVWAMSIQLRTTTFRHCKNINHQAMTRS